jgi:AcrR family transcriptional regulator
MPHSSPVTSLPPARATRRRILDAAEALFMQHGFEATSMRMITAEAGVNLASVNYHFGSKERLIEEVFTRRLTGLNAERLLRLDALETEAAGAALPVEHIIEAFFGPALRLSGDIEHGGHVFVRLLGRAYTEPARFIRDYLAAHYAAVLARFKKAFVRSLPHLSTDELLWRMHFMLGTMSYTIAGTDALRIVASCGREQAEDMDTVMRRITPFLVAGLTAPAATSEAAPLNMRHPLKQQARKRSPRNARSERKAA